MFIVHKVTFNTSDEKLATICIFTGISHGENPSTLEFLWRPFLLMKFPSSKVDPPKKLLFNIWFCLSNPAFLQLQICNFPLFCEMQIQ